MTVYIIRRADNTLTAVSEPVDVAECAYLRALTTDAGAKIIGRVPVRVEDPHEYCNALIRDVAEVRRWADVDRAATLAVQDLRRAARRAVARYRARKAQDSANTPDEREP